MIDITRKDLSKQYPVYTKAGTIWKNRIDWNSILKPGTVISTHFGIFTFVNTYKENKVWYIILSDGVNNYTVKRQQARNNKKLPKNSKVQQIIYLANVDILDSLIAEVTEVRKAYNKKNSTKADEKPLSNDILQKLSYILNILGIDEELYNNYKRQLVNYYHPDKNKNADPSIMELLNFLFDMYRHSKQFIRRSWVNDEI